MRNAVIILLIVMAAQLCSVAADRDATILPASFNGWQADPATLKSGADPKIADAAEAAVLREYGFSDAMLATYTRDERKMLVKAARFATASGAFGAFTFYQQPQMASERIGDDAASDGLRVLFYRGNVLVDVLLDRITAMSAADLRALANGLPPTKGNLATTPGLPGSLPRQNYVSHSERYITGPVAMERLGVPLPATLVDFAMSPELVMAQYRGAWGQANMVLIEYPTPQIATEKMRAMQAALLPGGPFYFKRSGPQVVIVNGNVPQDEAQSLLASVNWDANVTLTQPTGPDLKNNVGNLIMGICVLIGLIALAALIFGFVFGGVRILAKKMFPNKVFDRPDDVEIIRLNLN